MSEIRKFMDSVEKHLGAGFTALYPHYSNIDEETQSEMMDIIKILSPYIAKHLSENDTWGKVRGENE